MPTPTGSDVTSYPVIILCVCAAALILAGIWHGLCELYRDAANIIGRLSRRHDEHDDWQSPDIDRPVVVHYRSRMHCNYCGRQGARYVLDLGKRACETCEYDQLCKTTNGG